MLGNTIRFTRLNNGI